MLTSPCYVISDTHLGVAPPAVERRVLEFLRALPGGAGSLVINGDLFDFWFEWKTVIPRPHFRILGALADLRDAGVDVLMLGGNHDSWGGDVLTRDVGVTYRLGGWSGLLADWRAQVEHGDGLRAQEDRGYRALRAVLRNPLAIRAFRLLHPDWATRLARGTSAASRRHQPWGGDEGAGLRRVAHARLRAQPSLELLVFGHSHAAALERVQGAGVYANAGTWLTEPTFLVITPEAIELRRWTGSSEGDCLHTIKRLAEKALP
jgi:UDP-2,3-diacylglucosamine hydrolase